MRISNHMICLLRNIYAGQDKQLELDMEQQTGSKLKKEYVKAGRLHIVTQLMQFICREHYAKCQDG